MFFWTQLRTEYSIRLWSRIAIVLAFGCSLSLAAVQVGKRMVRPSVVNTPADDVQEFGLLVDASIDGATFGQKGLPKELTIWMRLTPEGQKQYTLNAPMLFDLDLREWATFAIGEKSPSAVELAAHSIRPIGKYRLTVRLIPSKPAHALDKTIQEMDVGKLVRIEVDPPSDKELVLSWSRK